MQIVGRVSLGSARDDGITVDLADHLQHAAGGFVLAFLFQGANNRQNVRGFHLGNVLVTDKREDIFLQAVHDRAPVLFREVGGTGFVPFQSNILESVVGFGEQRFFDGLFLRSGVNAVGQQLFGFVPAITRILERDEWLFAEALVFRFLPESVGHAP